MHPGKRIDRDTLMVVFLVLSMNNKFYEINEINILSPLIAQRNDCMFIPPLNTLIILFFKAKGCTVSTSLPR